MIIHVGKYFEGGGILFQTYRDTNETFIAILFTSIVVSKG